MSLPKRLYDIYKSVSQCAAVTGTITDETLLEFQNLINSAQPTDNAEELTQRALVKSMYYSNPIGFIQYISLSKNRVGALILWTESKRIVRFFNLQGKVHLSWNSENQHYVAQRHNQAASQSASQSVDPATEQPTRQRNTRSAPRAKSNYRNHWVDKAANTATTNTEPAAVPVDSTKKSWGDM